MKSSHPTGLHFHRRNPHPDKERHGDCVTRAIVLGTGRPYQEIWGMITAKKRWYDGCRATANGGCPEHIGRAILDLYGWKYVRTPHGVFQADSMPGICIASQASHWVLVADGSIWDTWDSRGSRRKKLTGVYVPRWGASWLRVADWVQEAHDRMMLCNAA